jgi:folate-binding protein YgfZ
MPGEGRQHSNMTLVPAASAGSPVAASVQPSAADWAAVRDGTIWCPLATLGVLAIAGPDAQTFLQGQLSNDVRRIAPGQWQRTTYSSPKGRMLASLILAAEQSGGYRAVLAADLAETIRKRLAMFVLRSNVTVLDASSGTAVVGIAGVAAAEAVQTIVGAVPADAELRTQGDSGALALTANRFLVFVPRARLDALGSDLGPRARRVPEPVWQWLDVRAGIPLVTAATQDVLVLQAANLDLLDAVSFDKGCYTGQEIVARTHYLGRLKERMHAWHVDRPAVSPGARLYSSAFGDQACGTVVNAAPEPGGGTDFLAVVQTAAVDARDVHLDGPAGPAAEPLPLPYAIPEPTAPKRPKL